MTPLKIYYGDVEVMRASEWSFIHDATKNKIIIHFDNAKVMNIEQVPDSGDWSCVVKDRHYTKMYINESEDPTKGIITIYK